MFKNMCIQRGAFIACDCFIGSAFITELIYTLSPFDVLPERTYGILGLIDDILIILVITLGITRCFYNLYARDHMLLPDLNVEEEPPAPDP